VFISDNVGRFLGQGLSAINIDRFLASNVSNIIKIKDSYISVR